MQKIGRSWEGTPTIVEYKIEDGCIMENTLVGFGTIIVDKDFLDEMEKIAEELSGESDIVSLMGKIYNKVFNYYSSNALNEMSREQTYAANEIYDEDGMVIGTKISALKGRNISKCSEKSLAAYVILKKLCEIEGNDRKATLVLSYLSADQSSAEPHAFVMLNKDNCNDITKHILFDVENPTLVEDPNGDKRYFVGLYSLSDEEYASLITGEKFTPTSFFEMGSKYREVGPKRIYGKLSKTMHY